MGDQQMFQADGCFSVSRGVYGVLYSRQKKCICKFSKPARTFSLCRGLFQKMMANLTKTLIIAPKYCIIITIIYYGFVRAFGR